MKINNLKINKFGKLENKEINLKNNINIIYGKNESGKSTLLKFISAMFYGLSKNKNGKNITDMEKYTPWEEGDFSGKLLYELDNGKKYEIFREFKKKNPKIYDENLNDISKEFTIDKTKGNRFFVDQTKIDEEIFLSTIVSEQQELKIDKTVQGNLIQKTANLVTSGDDNISYQKIINKLNKKQLDEIGTNRTIEKPINIIENKLNKIKIEKNNIKNIDEEKNIIEKNKSDLNNKIKNDELKIELIKNIKKINEENILENEKIKLNKNEINIFDKKIEELNLELNKIKEIKLEKIENKNKILKNIFIPIILIIINLILYFIFKNIIINIFGIFILIIYLIFNFINNKKIKNKINNQEEKNKNIIDNKKLLEKNLDEIILNKNNKIKEIKNKEENLNIEKEIKINNLKNNYLNKLNEEEINYLLNNNINYLYENIQNKINENKLNIHKLEIEENNINKNIEKLSELVEEEQELKEEYENLINKNNIINLVKEELEKAYMEMKENISPKFTEELSKIISNISNEKYKNVKINDEGNLIVEVENGNYINLENLSVGTIEQLYLSLRLSFAEDISTEKLPIILDEAFAYYDEERLKNILEFLNNKFNDRQIILFTCTDREKDILNKINIEYNFIEM